MWQVLRQLSCIQSLSPNTITNMALDKNQIQSDLQTAMREIASAKDFEALKQAKIDFVGDKSALAKANQSLGSIDPKDRAEFGKLIGTARMQVNQAYDKKVFELESERDSRVLMTEKVDVTMDDARELSGGLHPLTILTNEISDLFLGLGYSVAEGPELESEWLNFDALNIPPDHPARTMQDTFFIEPIEAKLVLRTHTSPVQVRTMLEQKPPIYVICPGKTYRADELDATHTPVFHQVEGLVVDEDISMADLKGTLDYFAKSIFGTEVKTRLRPSFFPFTEPSAEVDVFFNDRWIEWGGCGMVNEKVLIACGVDTKKYSGFAFGMGLERTLMVKYGITDMHDIVEGDVRFTQSFGFGKR
jgi:phenylalanyl-tRNA synthetase alpha chain